MVLGAPLRRGGSDGGTGAAAALDTNPLTSSSLAAATVAASVPLPGRRPAGGDARAPRFTSMLRSRSWCRGVAVSRCGGVAVSRCRVPWCRGAACGAASAKSSNLIG